MDLRGRIVSVPAPIGGWNTRDSKDKMPPEDAAILTNWFPDVGYVRLRGGYSSHATGLGGNVETLAEYHATTVRKLIAAADGEIWDATNTGAASSLASGFTNDRWQWANFNGSMGFVNGADTPQVYDGSTVGNMTVSGVGLTVSNLIGINVYKSRSYFWEANSQDFWYSSTNALGGSLTKFPLSRVSQFGGNLTTMCTWTMDGGNGPDDYAVFIMSSGDVIVYQGSDPGSADDWSLVGIYRIGAPLSIRSAIKIGGDVCIISKDDYVFLSKVLKDGTSHKKTKAVGALQTAVRSYASNFGWQAILYPQGSMAIFNIPTTTSRFEQHVLNIKTGAWTKFTNWNARCFGLYNDNLYFGGNGVVYKADTGLQDGDGAISGDALTAWNRFGTQRVKQMTAVRNLMETNGATINVSSAVGADFNEPNTSYDTTSSVVATTPWDTSEWDDASWPNEFAVSNDWKSAAAMGHIFAQRVKVSTGTQTVRWNSSDYIIQPGGFV